MEGLSKSEVLDIVSWYIEYVLDSYESSGKDDFLNRTDKIVIDVCMLIKREDYELTDKIISWIREEVISQSNTRLTYDLAYKLFDQIDELKNYAIHETKVERISKDIPMTSAFYVRTGIKGMDRNFAVLDTDLMVFFNLLKERHPSKTDSEIVEGIMDKKELSKLLGAKNETYLEGEYKNTSYRIYEI